MRWALLCAVSAAFPVWAHDADVIYVQVEARPDALLELLTLTANTLTLLAPIDADGDGVLTLEELEAGAAAVKAGVWHDIPLTAGAARCEVGATGARLREGFVELSARWSCPPGELRQDFRVLRVLPPNYRVVLGSQAAGERQAQAVAQGSFSTLPIARPPPPGAWDARSFARAFDEGVRRALTAGALALLAALFFSFTAWRGGLLALAFLLGAMTAGSFVPLPWWPASLAAVLVALTAAVLNRPHMLLALPLGFALGARDGGETWPASLGLASGTCAVWLLLVPALLAVGVLLSRRARARRVLRVLAVSGAIVLVPQW